MTHVVSPGPVVLPLLSFGFLWLLACQGRGRWLGAPLMAAALALWLQAERPAVLIADSGGLVWHFRPGGTCVVQTAW